MKQKFTIDWTWTSEQKEMSEYLFSGKLIKLYYSKNIDISDLYFSEVDTIENKSSTYSIVDGTGSLLGEQIALIFPERLMCLESIGQLITKIVKSAAKEIIIVTTTPYLMLELTTNLVTIIDNYNFTPPAGFDTLQANMHDVYYKTHDKGEMFKESKNSINNVIQKITNKKQISELDQKIVNLIGEPVINRKLNEMIRANLPEKDKKQAEIEYLETEIKRLQKLRA